MLKPIKNVMSARIREMLDYDQPREQAGFSKGYSTMDHGHAINLIIEKFAEYNKSLYMAFIDYEKAFDSIKIRAVLEALRLQGVPEAGT